MHLLVYSILISCALILTIFLVTFLTDRRFLRKQKLDILEKAGKLYDPYIKKVGLVAFKTSEYLGSLSIAIQEH